MLGFLINFFGLDFALNVSVSVEPAQKVWLMAESEATGRAVLLRTVVVVVLVQPLALPTVTV